MVFVMGAFAEMLGDVNRICDIIAHDLARTTSRTTTTMPSAPRACTSSTSRRPGGTWRTADGPVSSSTAPGTSSSTARRTAAPTARRCRRTRMTRKASFLFPPREGGLLCRLGTRSFCYCYRCLDHMQASLLCAVCRVVPELLLPGPCGLGSEKSKKQLANGPHCATPPCFCQTHRRPAPRSERAYPTRIFIVLLIWCNVHASELQLS